MNLHEYINRLIEMLDTLPKTELANVKAIRRIKKENNKIKIKFYEKTIISEITKKDLEEETVNKKFEEIKEILNNIV